MTLKNSSTQSFAEADNASRATMDHLEQLRDNAPDFVERYFYTVQLAILRASNDAIIEERKRVDKDLLVQDYAASIVTELSHALAVSLFQIVGGFTEPQDIQPVIAGACGLMGERLNYCVNIFYTEMAKEAQNTTPDPMPTILPPGSTLQ